MPEQRIRFLIDGPDLYIHADEMATAIKERAMLVLRESITQAAEVGGGISEEIISVFDTATGSALRAIADLQEEAIKMIQTEGN